MAESAKAGGWSHTAFLQCHSTEWSLVLPWVTSETLSHMHLIPFPVHQLSSGNNTCVNLKRWKKKNRNTTKQIIKCTERNRNESNREAEMWCGSQRLHSVEYVAEDRQLLGSTRPASCDGQQQRTYDQEAQGLLRMLCDPSPLALAWAAVA